MPDTPSQTLTQAIQSAMNYLGFGPQAKRARVEERTVDAVDGQGNVLVAGAALRTTGDSSGIQAGDRVAVLFSRASLARGRRGVKPTLVLAHQAKRPSPGGIQRITKTGIVEELYIAEGDIWFRNAAQVTRLECRAVIQQEPLGVAWGVDGAHFTVWTEEFTYHIFALNREPHEAFNTLAKASFLRTEQPFLRADPIITISASANVHGVQQYVRLAAQDTLEEDPGEPVGSFVKMHPVFDTPTVVSESFGLSGSSVLSLTFRGVFHDRSPFATAWDRVVSDTVFESAGYKSYTLLIQDTILDSQGRLRFTLFVYLLTSQSASSDTNGPPVGTWNSDASEFETSPTGISWEVLTNESLAGAWGPDCGWLWRSFKPSCGFGYDETRLPIGIMPPGTFPDHTWTLTGWLDDSDPTGLTDTRAMDQPTTVISMPFDADGTDADGHYHHFISTGRVFEQEAGKEPWPVPPAARTTQSCAFTGDTGGTRSTGPDAWDPAEQGTLQDPAMLSFVSAMWQRVGLGDPFRREDAVFDSSASALAATCYGCEVTATIPAITSHLPGITHTDPREFRLLHWDDDPIRQRWFIVMFPILNLNLVEIPEHYGCFACVLNGRGELVVAVQDVATSSDAPILIAGQMLSGSETHLVWYRTISELGVTRGEIVLTDLVTRASRVLVSPSLLGSAQAWNNADLEFSDAVRVTAGVEAPTARLYAWGATRRTFINPQSPTMLDLWPDPTAPQGELVSLNDDDVAQADGIVMAVPDQASLGGWFTVVAYTIHGSVHASSRVVRLAGASTLRWTNPPGTVRVSVYFDAYPTMASPSLIRWELGAVEEMGLSPAPPWASYEKFAPGGRLPARAIRYDPRFL